MSAKIVQPGIPVLVIELVAADLAGLGRLLPDMDGYGSGIRATLPIGDRVLECVRPGESHIRLVYNTAIAAGVDEYDLAVRWIRSAADTDRIAIRVAVVVQHADFDGRILHSGGGIVIGDRRMVLRWLLFRAVPELVAGQGLSLERIGILNPTRVKHGASHARCPGGGIVARVRLHDAVVFEPDVRLQPVPAVGVRRRGGNEAALLAAVAGAVERDRNATQRRAFIPHLPLVDPA
jgi:hypothetical protein